MDETKDERRLRLGIIPKYPRFSIRLGKNKQFYWTAIAANHEPVADGCEGYRNIEDCRAGLELIRSGAAQWPVLVEIAKSKPRKAKAKAKASRRTRR